MITLILNSVCCVVLFEDRVLMPTALPRLRGAKADRISMATRTSLTAMNRRRFMPLLPDISLASHWKAIGSCILSWGTPSDCRRVDAGGRVKKPSGPVKNVLTKLLAVRLRVGTSPGLLMWSTAMTVTGSSSSSGPAIFCMVLRARLKAACCWANCANSVSCLSLFSASALLRSIMVIWW